MRDFNVYHAQPSGFTVCENPTTLRPLTVGPGSDDTLDLTPAL